METFLTTIETLPAWQKGSIVLLSLLTCWLLEIKTPLFKSSYSKLKHGAINLSFFLYISAINLIFSSVLLFLSSDFSFTQYGLLSHLEIPMLGKLLISVLLLDFVAQYLVHICLHKIPWLWKFHAMHHSDTNLDATSGTRHHPIDYLMREVFSLITIFIFGIPVSHYILYRTLTIFFTYFNHANIQLPSLINKALAVIFITPDIHKIHHHYKQPWTDRNFGNIFSFWDRLFNTLEKAPATEVQYGLDSLDDRFKDSPMSLLLLPWKLNSK